MTSETLHFARLRPSHLFLVEPQESQRTQCGIAPAAMSVEEANNLADQGNAWVAMRGPRVIACLGIMETFPGQQGVAWALLSRHLGRDIVPVTRFARDAVIGTSALARIEAIVRCQDLPEWLGAERSPQVRHAIALEWASRNSTPQVHWAMKVGLEPVAVLRRFGAAGETHMLLERILP